MTHEIETLNRLLAGKTISRVEEKDGSINIVTGGTMNNRLTLDEVFNTLRALGNPAILEQLNNQGLRVDWKEVFDTIREGIVVEKPKVGEPEKVLDFPSYKKGHEDAKKESWFDYVGKDAPKPLAEIRAELNQLIRENDEGTSIAGLNSRILGILEQIVMNLENVPKFNWSVPGIAPFPMVPNTTIPAGPYVPQVPAGPNFSPTYIGDPPFPGSSTICKSITPVAQADGHVVGYEDAKTERYPDDINELRIPF